MREGLVAAGRSILPSERAVKGHAPDTLEYRPGFLVPIGAQELTLLVGELEYSGGQRIPSWDEIDGWLASGLSADQVSARLKEQHFIVKRLTVREPK